MWLDCGPYGRLDLSRVTPKSVVARGATRDIPACEAVLVVMVDGRCHRTKVTMGNFSKDRGVAFINPADGVAPF